MTRLEGASERARMTSELEHAQEQLQCEVLRPSAAEGKMAICDGTRRVLAFVYGMEVSARI